MTPLLTIAIPTFNRSALLRLCLDQICKELDSFARVEIMVSDNHSTDNTQDVIREFIGKGFPIRYIRHSENIGAEKNVIQCFERAQGKYLLILGDDDLLLDGALNLILDVLDQKEYGVVYLNGYGFFNDYKEKKPYAWIKNLLFWKMRRQNIIEFDNSEDFIRCIHYYITCLSCIIINKSFVQEKIYPHEFLDTQLPQLSWVIPAILETGRHAYIHRHMIASKKGNSGGYQLCQVFGTNINRIFREFEKRGANTRMFDHINRRLVKIYFPHYLLVARNNTDGTQYLEEDYYKVLKPIYHQYAGFWLILAPIIRLPRGLARTWHLFTHFIVLSYDLLHLQITGRPFKL